MTNHTILMPNKIAAKDTDSFVRPVKVDQDTDNGYVFALQAKETGTNETQLWSPTVPTSGSLAFLWMALEPELPFALAGTNVYNGIGTVRDFYTTASGVVTAYLPRVGDIITVTSEAFVSGTVPTAGQFAYAANGTFLLTSGAWPASTAETVGGCLIYRYLGTVNIPFSSGSISFNRITGYQLECVKN